MKSRNANHNGRVTPKRQKAAGVISVAALTLGGLGTAALLTAGTASADVASASTTAYTIGSGSVSNVSATQSSLAAGATATYTVSFTTPVALVGGTDTITIADGAATPHTTFPALGNNYSIVDQTTPSGSGAVAAGAAASGTTETITVPNNIAAGDTVTVNIAGVTNPASANAGTYNLLVSTSKDTLPVATASYQITAAAAAPSAAVSASPNTPGAGGSTYTLSGFVPTAIAAGSNIPVIVTDNTVAGSYNGVWPAVASDYTITDTTSAGTQVFSAAAATASVATSIPAAGSTTITLTAPTGDNIGATDIVTITATGVTNPTPTQVDQFTVNGKPTANAPTVTLGTSVSNLSVMPSNATQGAVASYTVGMKVTSALNGLAGVINLTAPAGTSFSAPTNVTITDSTTSSGSGVVAAITPSSVNGGTNNALAITVPNNIKAGDSLSLSIPAVTNPSAGTYSSSSTSGAFTATTSNDLVVATAPSYTINPPSTQAAPVSVSVTPSAPSAVATYTIANLQTNAAITGGAAGGAIVITGPSGTVFPAAASDYTITDLTNGAGSGTPTTSGGNTNSITLTPSNNIASGDVIQITATGVTNPSSPGSYHLTSITGPVVAAQVTTGTPSAGVTYPNGGFFLNSGTIYETVGGAAIAVPDLTTLAKLDPGYAIAAPNGNVPTQTVPRMGTLVQALGSPGIWVVGSNNTLYAFTSPSDFLSKGYDPAMVVTVPSIPTSWTTSTSAAPNAATTMSNGAMVLAPNGGIYEYAGGNAFLIPNLTTYFTIAASDPATVLSVTSTPSTSATVANGTLWLSVSGGSAINVEYNGQAQPFSSLSAMYSGGYNPYMTITIP